ncbi:MAG: hypothetical protein ACFFG0_05025 [Candidatus Thorarchaeota archaeon]
MNLYASMRFDPRLTPLNQYKMSLNIIVKVEAKKGRETENGIFLYSVKKIFNNPIDRLPPKLPAMVIILS